MWWGWVSLSGVWWGVGSLSVRLLATAARGVLSLLWLTASNCGNGLPKVLQQLRQGFQAAAVGSVVLVTVAGFGGLARWLSVLLSLLGGCPFCLWCCVRVAPVALSAFPCRWPHLVGCLSVWGFGSARVGSMWCCGFGVCCRLGVWLWVRWCLSW